MKHKITTNLRYLRKKSEEAALIKIDDIIKDLEDSLDTNKGIGLAAIQIGIPYRISIIRIRNGLNLNLINAKILEKGGKGRFVNEGCLSLPGLYIDTLRYDWIKIENYRLDGTKYEAVMEDLEATVCQHELNHWDGILILDRKWRKR